MKSYQENHPIPRSPGFLAAIVLALNCTILGAQAAEGNSPDKVKLSSGVIEGFKRQDGLRVFKGIPFAAPPIGELRWKAPQPVQPWEGIRSAKKFGPEPTQNEDCLYLNVWTKAKDEAERRPVMVYIYGGAFNGGAGSDAGYDGGNFAEKGVVLVTFNHRVGIFGFFAHPELSAETGKGSGCYGIQDQIAALRWVKENIARFGGDPSNMTVFGQSSGGTSVSILSQSPLAKGLFQRAICQSGGAMAPIKPAADKPGGMIVSLALAEELGKMCFTRLGVTNLKAARALTTDAVRKGTVGLPWPIADGEVIVGDPQELFRSGRFNDTPILLGIMSNDGGLFGGFGQKTPEEFEQTVRKDFVDGADVILAAYPHSTKDEAARASRDVIREMLFGWQTWSWAMLQSENGKGKAFLYYFDYGGKPGEAGHGGDVPYVFGNLGGWFKPAASEENKGMSEKIMSYWVNFAKTGDPNGTDLPQWPAFHGDTMKAMIFGKTPQAGPVPNLEKIRAIDAYWTTVRAKRNAY
ncbi:MAG TPA: carboxylesterase family protein [Candidatus Paceibacterota bacterium]|nr:carboxylesterase family protein [Verrucomicrobiota bacterium]HRY51793.1 carboxylesterase family protein [Candidatus Paceibacterota bacterium]